MFSIASLSKRDFNWRCALSLATASDLAYHARDVVTAVATGACRWLPGVSKL